MKDNFLEPETISGYYVDEKMKKIWKCELDLLEKFISVCEKYELRYFMSGGSLLGAIRHKGFIPWDDDIDVDMFREDYEKLIKIAPEEFTGNLFFQTSYNDNGYVRPHVQIRNSDTTAIVEHEKGLKFNQGIFIDIFPLDAVPRNKVMKRIQSIVMFFWMNFLRAGIMVNPQFNDCTWKNVAHYIAWPFFKVVNYKYFFSLYEKISSYYNEDKTLQVGEISFDYSDHCIWDRHYFDDIVMKDFAYLKVACPKEYDKVLTKTFGDYMTPLKSPSYHGNVFFDTETPYKVSLKRLFDITV